MLVGYVYNPSYSGGRDQQNHGSKPAQAKCSQDPILKNNQHKQGLAEGLKWWSTCLASIRLLYVFVEDLLCSRSWTRQYGDQSK
jgi:hypothetical protein